ncbi:MAG: hypothetical protein ACRC4G_05720 [Alphaproteobacteria bacterium]
MQAESWARGQMFDRMLALATFAGNKDFWEDLPVEFQREYAVACRPNPRDRLFSLEMWRANEGIQGAIAEYNAEKEAEGADQSNVDIDF